MFLHRYNAFWILLKSCFYYTKWTFFSLAFQKLEGGRVDFNNLLISCSVCYIYLPYCFKKDDDTKFKRIGTEYFVLPLFLFSTINKINKCNKERRKVCDHSGICWDIIVIKGLWFCGGNIEIKAVDISTFFLNTHLQTRPLLFCPNADFSPQFEVAAWSSSKAPKFCSHFNASLISHS